MAAGFEHELSRRVVPAKTPNWRPLPFYPFYPLALVVLHILQIVGIQLLVNKYNSDRPAIDLARQNPTAPTENKSFFIFDESSATVFLAWQYLPVAIATLVAISWEVLDVAVRRLEPFLQLCSNEGGTASNALCLDYVTKFTPFVPFCAIGNRHFAVAISSALFIVTASIIPAVTGGLSNINWASLSTQAAGDSPTLATVSINAGFAIAAQACHGVAAIAGIVLAWILYRRRTGLYHDPRGIGGTIPLISEADHAGSSALSLFRQIPSFAHSRVACRSLEGIVFQLRHLPVTQTDGTIRTTLQLTANSHPAHSLALTNEDYKFAYDRGDAAGWWLSKGAIWGAEIFLWLGQAAIIGALYKVAMTLKLDDDTDAIKRTISKMVFILSTSLGGMMWQSIQRDLQALEPWRQLARNGGGRIFETLVQPDIVSLGLVGGMAASLRKGWLVSLVASFIVFMVHAAVVFMPPLLELGSLVLNRSPHERLHGLAKGAPGLAIVVTGVAIHLVIFSNMVFLLLSGRTRPFMPRQPTTIASQILYFCRSEALLAEFTGTSTASKHELMRYLDSRYSNNNINRNGQFGWFWWWRGRAWCVGVELNDAGPSRVPFDFNQGACTVTPCT
ncbi:hypothetical protein FQN49_004658 [Arthroderma sp. PD_2]|nr:hypothetical protein FQN49_004658 [Arthroderma sp. PD_2]